jgi:hypothetical protein
MDQWYWKPLFEFLRSRALAARSIAERDLAYLTVTDSPERAMKTILGGVHRKVVAAFGAAARRPEPPRP